MENKKDKELKEIYIQIGKLIICSIIGGVIGYAFCISNGYNPMKGVILGVACPWGYIIVDMLSKSLYSVLEDLYKLVCLITFGIYAIAWFILKLCISALVGLIAGPIIAIYYIVKIRKVWKADYSDIEYPNENTKSSINLTPNTSIKKEEVNEDISNEYEEKYYCEMCFKRISKEEYELHECLCEECYMDIHTDEDGNFKEDYFKY